MMPVQHSLSSGITGGGCTQKDYRIVDKEDVYHRRWKIFCCMLIDLLWDQAKEAESIMKEYKPDLSKEQYLEMMDSMERTICYGQENE